MITTRYSYHSEQYNLTIYIKLSHTSGIMILVLYCLAAPHRLIAAFSQSSGAEDFFPTVCKGRAKDRILSHNFVHQNLTQLSIFVPLLSCGSSDSDDMIIALIWMISWAMEVVIFLKSDILGNDTRNRLAKVSSNTTIKQISRDKGSSKSVILSTAIAMAACKLLANGVLIHQIV